MQADLKYINAFKDRHGRQRWYFRRNGWSIPLPDPDSRGFSTAYADALKKSDVRKDAAVTSAQRGSLDYAKELWYTSAEFNNLALATRRHARWVLEALCNRTGKSGVRYGEGSFARIRKQDVLAWRDAIRNRPGAANAMVRILSMLFIFGMDRGLCSDNPTKGIKLLKISEHRDWTDDELIQFEKAWPLGTLERTGYALALYTAQRRQDLVRMKWSDISDNSIFIAQSKTGHKIEVPIHPELQKALDAVSKFGRGKTILTGQKGNPLDPVYFGHLMAAAIDAAKLPDDCVLHGLRKSAARIVQELGGKVGSLTGHVSPEMERKYAKRADQWQNAVVAIDAWAERSRKKSR